jgi:hypothetical protein
LSRDPTTGADCLSVVARIERSAIRGWPAPARSFPDFAKCSIRATQGRLYRPNSRSISELSRPAAASGRAKVRVGADRRSRVTDKAEAPAENHDSQRLAPLTNG